MTQARKQPRRRIRPGDFTPDVVKRERAKAKAILRRADALESLTDEALAILIAMAEGELEKRGSRLRSPGTTRLRTLLNQPEA